MGICSSFMSNRTHVPRTATLGQIGIPRSTFYRWYDQYQTGGPEALDGSVGGSPIGSISASASVDRLSTRLPSAGSPARPGEALATLWVNRGAINQRQDDTAACGSADRLATSTMRTVRMKPGPHFTESLSIASGPIGPHSRACPKRSRQLSALFPGTERSARSWLNAERDTARDRFRPNLA